MTRIQEKIEEVFFNSLNETYQCLKIDEQVAFLEDRFTGITRTRTTAELCSSMIKIHKLNKKNFKESIKRIKNPYGKGNAAKIIVSNLRKIRLDNKLLMKKFIDIKI